MSAEPTRAGLAAADAVVVVRGAGSIGMRHLRVLRERLGVRAVAMPARPERAAELAAQGVPAVRVAAEATALGSAATVVATNTSRHLADVREALRYGDVLVEKPLAPDAAGLGAVADEAEALGRRVHVGFCLRFNGGLRRFRERLPEVGPVDSVRVECQSFLPAWRPDTDHRASYSASASEGGVLRDLAHELDYSAWLFGRPAAVYCALGNTGRLGIESDEWAELMWAAPSGARVSLRLDYLSPATRRRLRATGAAGELEWDAVAGSVTLRRAGGAPPEVETVAEDRDAMYARQAEAFLDAVAGGDAGELATFDDGAFVVALSDAARASSRSGRVTPVADWRAA